MIGLVISLIAVKGFLLTIVGSSNPLANNRFEEILEIDGIFLDPMEYNYRLDVFTSQCENMTKDINDPCPYANSQYMYTEGEKDYMNGAERDMDAVDNFIVEGADEELFKRLEVDLPTSYDVRDDVEVRVTSQGVCGNCYVQAVIGALEIAYYKHTEEIVHFSAQELTECFYQGCDGADPKHVIQHLSHIDHLSSQMDYGRYLAGRGNGLGTCKTATTPDSLLKVKVLGYKVISADEIDHYVYMNGAVVVCLDWDTNCKLNNYVGGVYDDKTSEGCDHAVIIVGYTPEYWIAKNSHGLSWGENGYFRIKRGSSVCGIENYPLAIITELRNGNKEGVHPDSHCPIERPNYCEDTHTCTKESNCTESIITGKYSHSAEEALGHCAKPNIANGRLTIVGNENIIEAGEEFKIECSPGFVLLGPDTMECVIQEVYKPDTRMIPECVPQSRFSEEYKNNGLTYSGTKNKTSIGNSCWNWKEVWITGRASTAIGKNQFTRENFLEGGNHNFCRNVGGNKPVPFCLERRYTETGKLQSKFNFCFTNPSCDTISCAEVEDKHRSCSHKADKCAYGKYSQSSTDKNWVNCKKTCCEVSGC